MSTHISRAAGSASAGGLWPHAEPARGLAVRLVRQWIVAAVAKAIAAMRKRQLLLRAERELHYLDDRMLKDIGIARSEISSIARFGRSSLVRDQLGIWS